MKNLNLTIRLAWTLLATGFCIPTFAQYLPNVASGAMAYNLSVARVSNLPNGFTAKTRVEYTDTNGQWAASFVFYQGVTNARCDFDVTECGNSPEQIKANLRLYGLDNLSAIVNTELQTLDLVCPKNKSYIHMEAPPSLKKIIKLLKQSQPKRENLGDEILDGVSCKKVRIIDPESPDVTVTAWMNAKDDSLPRRIDIVRGTEQTKITIVPVALSAPDDKVLRVPSGLKHCTNYLEFVQAGMVANKTPSPGK